MLAKNGLEMVMCGRIQLDIIQFCAMNTQDYIYYQLISIILIITCFSTPA